MSAEQGRLPILGQGAPAMVPSIFNDVIGPVMRGPSSSHCAAAVRIGRLARDLMGGDLKEVLVEYHPGGSLATTHRSQGSDMGLFGGLLGWDAAHERLVESEEAVREAGIQVTMKITDYPAPHPNTYRMTLRGREGEHGMTAISTGGGIVRVVEIDGVALDIAGDFHETLVFLGSAVEGPSRLEEALGRLEATVVGAEVLLHRPHGGDGRNGALLQIRAPAFVSFDTLKKSLPGLEITEIRTLAPVLPIQSRKGMEVPFLTAREMRAYAESRGEGEDREPSLWELAVEFESARGGIAGQEVIRRMMEIVDILERSVAIGIAGTEFADRILPEQTSLYGERWKTGKLLDSGMLNRMVLYVSALMEVKSSMGVVVAAPTAGSCGALPGAVLGAGHTLGLSGEEMARAMLAAGIIGVFITHGSTFAAEVCGCQAECGAGSGMAAAALVVLAGGTLHQAVGAASMALQNTLGMICDPVANRVEVPCLGRNVLAASNALSCANMALADFESVVPLDEVIGAMDEVGRSLPHQLRCTALGGLSVTDTSRRIEKELENRGNR